MPPETDASREVAPKLAITSLLYRVRTDRIVAASRVALSGLALVAIWLDPTQPARFATVAYWILWGYCAFASLVWAAALRSRRPLPAIGPVAHLTDLVVFTVLMVLTEGVTSPFFVFFTFSILCAALRWRARGVLATGAVMLLSLTVTAFWPWLGADHPEIEWNFLIIRITYALVIMCIFAYMSAEQNRQLGEIAKLSIQDDDPSPAAVLRLFLEHVLSVYPKARVVLLHSDPLEPWVTVASITGAGFQQGREAPEVLHADGELTEGQSFYAAAPSDPSMPILWRDGTETIRPDLALAPAFVQRFSMRHVLVVPFGGTLARGCLFILDVPNMTQDDFILGEILAGQIAASLDRQLLSEELTRAAAAGERVRLASEIHDTVMQSLVGMRLGVQAILQSGKLPPESAAKLTEIRDELSEELRELRTYLGELSPGGPLRPHVRVGLSAGIEATSRRLARQWNIEMHNDALPGDLKMSAAEVHEISCIIAEATANAVRHGGASRLSVSAMVRGGLLELHIEDNGKGFTPYRSYSHSELLAARTSPRSILRRVATLGAAIDMETSPRGVVIKIVVPVDSEELELVN